MFGAWLRRRKSSNAAPTATLALVAVRSRSETAAEGKPDHGSSVLHRLRDVQGPLYLPGNRQSGLLPTWWNRDDDWVVAECKLK